MNKINPSFVIVIILVVVTVIVSSFPNVISYTYAYSQEKLTDKETLKVKLTTEPEEPKPKEITKLNIEFTSSQSNKTQENVDYTIRIENNGNEIPRSNNQTHTMSGYVSIPVMLEEGINNITINVIRILFEPIPIEIVTFDLEIENQTSRDKSLVIEEEEEDKELSGIIPLQFKNHAALWTKGQIDGDSFVQGIEALIKDRIISVSSSYIVSDSDNDTTREIPQWTKNNVDWWLQGLISEDIFLQGIEYMIENEIIVVGVSV